MTSIYTVSWSITFFFSLNLRSNIKNKYESPFLPFEKINYALRAHKRDPFIEFIKVYICKFRFMETLNNDKIEVIF